MATREALEAGRRLRIAEADLIRRLGGVDARTLDFLDRLQRAAIKVGEVRERNRKRKAVR